jgi:putative photosynthetic complex assembly protein
MNRDRLSTSPQPIIGLFALLAVILACVAVSQWLRPTPRAKLTNPIVERSLAFRDEPDGAISVTDTVTGQTIAEFRGEQGFVRGTLRALARERKRQGLGASLPLTLALDSDRRLILRDPTTGELIDLASFGTTQREVFASLLLAPPLPLKTVHAGATP